MELGTDVLSTERNLRLFLSDSQKNAKVLINGTQKQQNMNGAEILQQYMEQLDRKANGTVTGKLKPTDFQQAFKQAGFKLETSQIKSILSKFPRDSRGRINCTEFLK